MNKGESGAVWPLASPYREARGKPDTPEARPSGPHGRGQTSQTLEQRLLNPQAMLSRTDLRALGYERRAVDAIFRALPVVVLDGYARPLIKVSDYVELVERSTYDATRVRPTGRR
jgi:hypothetical protein